MGLKDAVDQVWEAAKTRISSGIQAEQQGVEFYEWGEFYARRTTRNLVVLSRVVGFEEGAVNLVLFELSVMFGSMVQSGDKGKGKDEAEQLAFWLAEYLLDDPQLSGAARDMRVDAIELDIEPPEPVAARRQESETQQWVATTVVWRGEFSRP